MEVIKELRARTNAPVLDCKKALAAEGVDGDISKAIDWLRSKGVASALKRSGRAAGEGLVAVSTDDSRAKAAMIEVGKRCEEGSITPLARCGAASHRKRPSFRLGDRVMDLPLERCRRTMLRVCVLLSALVCLSVCLTRSCSYLLSSSTSWFFFGQVNCETDFVAKSDIFADMVNEMAGARLAHEGGDDDESWKEQASEMILATAAKVQENVQLRRGNVQEAPLVASYVHGAVAPGAGKAAAVVGLSAPTDALADAEKRAVLERTGSQIAMHVVAASPLAVTEAGLDAGVVERERAVVLEQSDVGGKPEHIVEKMISGRMKKFYKEVVLLDQEYLGPGDGKETVSQVLDRLGKEVGGEVQVQDFALYRVGEDAAAAEDGQE